MQIARRIFWIAAIYGILATTPLFFLESRLGHDFPPVITHPEFFYGFAGVALAWQIAFIYIAREPVRLRPIMIPAMLEKLSFGFAGVILFMLGRVPLTGAATAMMDLVFAGLFWRAYRRTAVSGCQS